MDLIQLIIINGSYFLIKGSSLLLTLINIVLLFTFIFLVFQLYFYAAKPLVIRQNQHFTLLVYHQGSNVDLIPFKLLSKSVL